MTTIKAEVIEDSVSPDGVRITTMALKYPRFIHSEFMTHRVFSRNASSSRAKPVRRIIEEIREDTAMPLVWTKNQPGMQGYEECDKHIMMPTYEMMPYGEGSSGHFHLSEMMERIDIIDREIVMPYHDSEYEREIAWEEAREMAIYFAKRFHDAGYHKQVVNRLLEPFMHIDVLVTSTDWANFFALRDHEAAEPHIQILAREMKQAMDGSKPKNLQYGDWHLPYVGDEENLYSLEDKIIVSVARCSRVSYSNHEGKVSTFEEDVKQYDRLVGSSPIHASPAEHQATPDWKDIDGLWNVPRFHGNLTGWMQYRKTLANESVFDHG